MKQLSLARMGALALAISAMTGAYAADTKSVAVTAIVEHPALDAVRDGVKDALKAAGYEVVGVSPDPVEKLGAFVADEALTFPLLSDPERTTLEAWGAWGEKNLYGKIVTGVIRSTVVVGADGRVRLAQYNVKATGHVAKLRRDLKIA